MLALFLLCFSSNLEMRLELPQTTIGTAMVLCHRFFLFEETRIPLLLTLTSYPAIRALDSRKEALLVRRWIPIQDRQLKLKQSYFLHLDNDHFDLFWTAKGPTINGRKGKTVGTSNGLICLVDYPPVKSNDFKVVSLVLRNYKVDSAWVFSYLNWSWKHVSNSTPPPCLLNQIFTSPVLINGVLHWNARNKVGEYDFVLTFDIAREVFKQIVAAGDSSIVVSSMDRMDYETIWGSEIMDKYSHMK
ncbi:hypothetical protein K1719_032354 [Acacia pycnantha]|nr:hypothetical protein K1719_032354 [Acacia pycnantha]